MAKRTRTKSHPRRSRSRSGSTSVVISAILGVVATAWFVWGEDMGMPFPSPAGSVVESPPPATPETQVSEADPAPAPAAIPDGAIAGIASVIDADTLDIRSERIRLVGVDAPESGQKCKDAKGAFTRCGTIAANALDAWINRNPVTCVSEGTDRYDRVLGKCSVRGQSVQDWLVRSGHAVAYRTYSTEFVDAELTAQQAKVGIWAGEFVMPWDWRKGIRMTGEEPTKAMREAGAR